MMIRDERTPGALGPDGPAAKPHWARKVDEASAGSRYKWDVGVLDLEWPSALTASVSGEPAMPGMEEAAHPLAKAAAFVHVRVEIQPPADRRRSVWGSWAASAMGVTAPPAADAPHQMALTVLAGSFATTDQV